MADEPNKGTSQPPGGELPAKPSQDAAGSAGAGGKDAGEQTFTLAQVQSLVKSEVAGAEQRIMRSSQGLVDKSSNLLQTRFRAELAPITKAIAAIEATGTKIPEDVKQGLKNAALMEAINPTEPSAEKPNGAAAQADTGGSPQETGQLDLIGQLAVSAMQRMGLWITDADEEVKLLDLETDDPAVFMPTLLTALKTKAARLSLVAGDGESETSEDETEEAQEEGKKGPGLNARGTGRKAGGKYLDGADPLENLHLGYGAR